jgi:uncharacterized protein (TIGR00375 family)
MDFIKEAIQELDRISGEEALNDKKTRLEINDEDIVADLHIHSRFSRACSKELNIPNLVKWARVKGIRLLGTGDFTHPEWLKELKELEKREGLLWYKDDKGEFPFLLSSEISLVYTHEGKGRRVHLVYLAPNFEAVDKINSWLDSKGRRDYDGRPIFGISCRDFVKAMKEIDNEIEVIPAHIWTPWFGVFGSKGGFDSLSEAFGDQVDHIHAIETGISSDPKMNWKVKELVDRDISIVSFSDLHSFWPWRLGREATIFSGEFSYENILNQIRENSFKATIETDPAYGKYHWDGHRNCNFSCSPDKTKELNGKCPKCGKNLIVGVDYRVEKLANNEEVPENAKPYFRLLPLHELISFAIGKGVNTKSVWSIYNKLIAKFGNELNILLKVDKNLLAQELKGYDYVLKMIIDNRIENINVQPGYDGEYGKIVNKDKQGTLF